MSTELQFDLDPSIKREFGALAGDRRVTRTAAALEANGIRAIGAADAAEAKLVVLGLIPDGAQSTMAPRSRLKYPASLMRSKSRAATNPCGLTSGDWTA